MLKLAATLLLILGGTGIGYARSREITEWEKDLEILLQIFVFLKGEIRCSNSSLPDAFREISGKISPPFREILRDAAKEMKKSDGRTLEEILKSCGEEKFCGKCRAEREMVRILQCLGSRLGYLDREMQICQIDLLETETEERRRKVREKLPEQKKLCQTLGVLGGILLAVLFW